MSDAERRQLVDAELANLSAMPATDRDFIGKSLERLVDQHLTSLGALRIFSVTGLRKRDEPMEMSMWDIESESKFGPDGFRLSVMEVRTDGRMDGRHRFKLEGALRAPLCLEDEH